MAVGMLKKYTKANETELARPIFAVLGQVDLDPVSKNSQTQSLVWGLVIGFRGKNPDSTRFRFLIK